MTSYATRTSPMIRGEWVLENILGTPPPPPLPNVPALKDNTISATLSVRERLAEHRANAVCASCHNLMDPPGFALENFDAKIEIWNQKNKYGWTPLLIAEGHRPGNFKPSVETITALQHVMLAAGISPPASTTPASAESSKDYPPNEAKQSVP